MLALPVLIATQLRRNDNRSSFGRYAFRGVRDP